MNSPAQVPRFEHLLGSDFLLDRSTGLVWWPPQANARLAFNDVLAPHLVEAWRLPSVSELMEIVCQGGESLPAAVEEPGVVFWSSSESPSAPETQVRVVVCEPGPTYRVALREKTLSASAWLVARTGDRNSADCDLYR